ncbi:hypothetical protein [Streptomyces sp. XD-27]|nr:hypothetical protein [Streptomyces sp. XD-27]WKX72409.1 hypothetical protein Q3Y56_23130 [Streptomyces sp. XD-27]
MRRGSSGTGAVGDRADREGGGPAARRRSYGGGQRPGKADAGDAYFT